MKNLDMLRLLNDIDDDLIEKANPQKLSYNRKRHSLYFLIASICLVCVLIVCLVIFIPRLKNDDPDITNPSAQGNVPVVVPPAVNPAVGATGIKESYEAIKAIIDEYQNSLVTPINYGIEGMDKVELEAGDYLYTLQNSHFYISLASDSTNYIGRYKLGEGEYKYNRIELLNEDTAVIFYEEIGGINAVSYAVTLSISSPQEISEIGRMSYVGRFAGVNYDGDELILISYFNVVDTTFVSGYIPTVNNQLLPVDRIVAPEKIHSARYVVTTRIVNGECNSSMAFLDFDASAYITSDNIYLGRVYPTEIVDRNTTIRGERTEVVNARLTDGGISFNNVATVEGKIVNGGIKEENNVLYVFASSSIRTEYSSVGSEAPQEIVTVSAYLYCIDVNDMSELSYYEGFNEEDEEITSVELTEKQAYLYVNNDTTDPVYVFDLSDASNVTYERITNN